MMYTGDDGNKIPRIQESCREKQQRYVVDSTLDGALAWLL